MSISCICFHLKFDSFWKYFILPCMQDSSRGNEKGYFLDKFKTLFSRKLLVFYFVEFLSWENRCLVTGVYKGHAPSFSSKFLFFVVVVISLKSNFLCHFHYWMIHFDQQRVIAFLFSMSLLGGSNMLISKKK